MKQFFYRKSHRAGLALAIDSLPIHNTQAIEDAYVYCQMSDVELKDLPTFSADDSVIFYEVGDVLLGKSALIAFVNKLKNK